MRRRPASQRSSTDTVARCTASASAQTGTNHFNGNSYGLHYEVSLSTHVHVHLTQKTHLLSFIAFITITLTVETCICSFSDENINYN